MDHITKQLKRHFSALRLTDGERSLMRDTILARVRATEAQAPRVPSPYAGFFMTLTFQRVSAFLALFAVALGSVSGVTLAAEDTVPGDSMYAIKVHVSEPLSTLAALTPSAKAAVATTHAERRLMEAEILAARGSLDIAVAEDLSERFTESAEVATDHIKGLTDEDPEEATMASVELQSVLSAHGRILENIVAARNGETEETLAVLRTDIAERAEAIERTRSEFRLASLEGERGRETSARLFANVTRDVDEAVETLAAESETSPEDALALDARVAVITEAIDEGKAKHELGAYADALLDFERAQSAIGVGKRLLEAKARFETDDVTVEEVEEEPVEDTAVATVVEDAAPEAATMMMTAQMKIGATTTATTTATSTGNEARKSYNRDDDSRSFRSWSPRPIRINLEP